MNAVANAMAAPPPLPPAVPAPVRAPGIGEALALLALYFCLQLAVGFATAALTGFAVGLQVGFEHATHGTGLGASTRGALRSAMADPELRTAVTAVTLLVAASATLWVVRRRWPRQWRLGQAWQGFGFTPAATPAFYAAALALGIGVPVIGGLLTHWLAGSHPVTQSIAQLGHQAPLWGRLALALLAVTLGPLVEETMFRGVLFASLLGFHRPAGSRGAPGQGRIASAMLVSAALFAAVHLPDLGWHWYALPNLALLGIGCAWLRLGSGSLWPSVTAHAINNVLAVAGWFLVIHPAT